MRRDVIKSGLVWAGLTAAVSGAFVSGGWDGPDPRAAAPPGHDARACGDRRAHQPARGPALPYELGGDDRVRFEYPDAGAAGASAEAGVHISRRFVRHLREGVRP